MLLALATFAACTPWYDREYCEPFDGSPAAERAGALGGLHIPDDARVLECMGTPGPIDEFACALELRPETFSTIFPTALFPVERPTDGSLPGLAMKYGIDIAGQLTTGVANGRMVYYNARRDRAIVRSFVTGRCATPSSVM